MIAFKLRKRGGINVLITVMCMVIILLTVCGCGDKYENVEVDVEDVADKINTEAEFDDTLVKLSDDVVRVKYPSLIDAKEIVVFAGSGATAEEIIVLELSNSETANSFSDKLKVHVSDMRETFTNYNSAELPKIDSAVNVVRGKYVIYCVSCNSSKVNDIIGSFFE